MFTIKLPARQPTRSRHYTRDHHITVFDSSPVSVLILFPDSPGLDDPSLLGGGGTACLEEERVLRPGTTSSPGSSRSSSRAGDGDGLFEGRPSGSSGPWRDEYEDEYAQSGSSGRGDRRELTESGRVGTPFLFNLKTTNRMRDRRNGEDKR
jgi:hypothetical protein